MDERHLASAISACASRRRARRVRAGLRAACRQRLPKAFGRYDRAAVPAAFLCGTSRRLSRLRGVLGLARRTGWRCKGRTMFIEELATKKKGEAGEQAAGAGDPERSAVITESGTDRAGAKGSECCAELMRGCNPAKDDAGIIATE